MATASDLTAPRFYRLRISASRQHWKLTDVMLALGDEGISYALDGRSGLRPFTQLESVRIEALVLGRNHPSQTLMHLSFKRGRPLVVHSGEALRADDPGHDQGFVAFVEDFHRRVPEAERDRIQFRRGMSEDGQPLFVTIVGVLLGGVACASLFINLFGSSSGNLAVDIIVGLVGLGGVCWMVAKSRRRNMPDSYDSRYPPRDLFPERA